MSTFSIEASCDGRVLTLACVGELDVATAAVLDDAIGAHEATGADHVVLDLARTTFIDSSGIAAIVRRELDLAARGGRLEIERPGRVVRRAFELCGLLHLIERDAAPA